MEMTTSLVIIRCQRCRARLGSLDTMPDDWTGTLTVSRCRKCVIPSPRRVVEVIAGQRAEGFAMKQMIPLAELRPHALKAKAGGRPETVNIRPSIKAL
jgi:hypothetical protein